MSDDRFTWLHLPLETSLDDASDDTDFWGVHLTEDRFDEAVWDLLPPYQDEDDESMLPSAAHPSYPYGNPYAPSSSRSAHWHSSNPLPSSSSKPQYRAGFPLPPQSVAGRGGLGGPRGSGWNDLALSQLLPGSRRDGGGHGREADDEEIGEGGPTGQEQQQDAPPAPGQIPDGTNGATANGEEGLQDDTGIVGVDDGGGGEEAMEEEEDDQLEPDDG